MEKDQNPNTDTNKSNEKISNLDDISTEKAQVEEKNKEQSLKEKDLSPEEKIKDLEDKVTRALAEMENQRRRYEKEKEDAFEYGGFAFARENLNLIDNLERAKQSLENDETLKNSEALKKTLEHLEIINKDLISIFKKNNIEPIDSVNKKLDPNIHQAMMEIENDQKEPGTIIQEIQKGFMMKDRLLRPALVAVAKKFKKKEDDTEKNKKNEQNQEKSIKNKN
ncbi:MAG: nucleotide exchange factor GrpE [Pelagibacterales bacterium]|nr:nucleotide exchange factor GrpE [Pelagibacterales bacterium]